MQLCVPLLSEDINSVPDFIMLTKIHPISSLLVSFLSQVEIASLEEEESVSERERSGSRGTSITLSVLRLLIYKDF